jgi:hypothetical protein
MATSEHDHSLNTRQRSATPNVHFDAKSLDPATKARLENIGSGLVSTAIWEGGKYVLEKLPWHQVFGSDILPPPHDIIETASRLWPYEGAALAASLAAQILARNVERERFDPRLLEVATIKRARDLRISAGNQFGDMVIPGWRPEIYQPREIESHAHRILVERRAVMLKGRPQSGKTRIAWQCLRRTPDTYVVIPRADHPPASAAKGLRGREVFLFLDDLHLHAETLNAERWRQYLTDASDGVCQLVATVRTGQDWIQFEKSQHALLRAIGSECILNVGDLSKEEGGALRSMLGMSPDEFEERWAGTPGSLVVGVAMAMRAGYDRLRSERVEGVSMSRLLDAAKLLHFAHQPVLREIILRQVSERILDSKKMGDEIWRTLLQRTAEEHFGIMREGEFWTYRPYLEQSDVIDYQPSVAECLALFDVLAEANNPDDLFQYAVAAQFDWQQLDHAEAAYRKAMILWADS